MEMNLVRSDLVKRLQAVDPSWIDTVMAPETRITPVPAPFLRGYYVLELERFLPSGPLLLFVACGPAGGAVVLNGDAAALARVLADDASQITSEAAALALVELYLRVVMTDRIVLRSVADVPWRPRLAPELAARRDELAVELARLLRPPTAATRIDGGFDVAVFVVEEMSVVRMTFAVTRKGEITQSSVVVKDDLPLVYRM